MYKKIQATRRDPGTGPMDYSDDQLDHFPMPEKNKRKGLTQQELDQYPVVPFSSDMIHQHFKSTDESEKSKSEPMPSSLDENREGDHQADDVDCLICFEPIVLGDDMVRQIPCDHIFHLVCLDTWLTKRSGFCPTCRYDLHSQA
ncbi:E3 ubiquitin-protein ligase SDIR1 [Smittium mucronatum]|uniref:E3 ubiquitin-protein ligase SDIR1 n=1 Tax=Smittium mucronatum TaxID=133383 RepID=A0A1R0H2D1_9FUNG|nr:E3 ubiquitin-protein ligase SDIR1 [Smittium mucronatum]